MLGDVASFSSGKTPPRSRQEDYFNKGSVPWVKTMDLTNAGITKTDELVTQKAIREVKFPILPVGTVLVAMYGGFNQIGRTGVLRFPATTNQALTAVLPDPKKLNSDYLLHFLNYRIGYWRNVASSSRKDPNITKADVESFPLNLPSLHEQNAIAAVINDADAHVSALTMRIVKQQAIRQGMMQQLLTGNIRLPTFGETWRSVAVGELLEFKNGLNKAGQYFGSGTPIVNFMDVMRGPIITAADVTGRVAVTQDEIKRFSAGRGDLFFTRTSETVEEVGTATVLVDEIPNSVFSGFILRGRPRTDQSDSRFLSYVFQLEAIRKQVTAKATYTTRALTNGRSLSRVTIELPPLSEQRAIANAIADTDGQITDLRARLDKSRAVKQGMMQQLLSGRTRLSV
jgi:type I restriction enzyme S subunit